MESNRSPEKYWKRYEKGKDYIRKKNLITRTNKNWNFYIGKQWEGIQSGGEELPFFNFIKRTIKHRVFSITQNRMIANYSDSECREENNEIYQKLNAQFAVCWEKSNMDKEFGETLKDAAVTGDGIQFYGTANVADMQRLSCTSVLYGDESNPNIQAQPYIIIEQRLAVDVVKQQAKENGLSEEDIALILPDNENQDLIGNKDELDGDTTGSESKVTCIIHMERKNGIVHVSKCTKNVVYEKEHPIASIRKDGSIAKGLTLYPLAKISWEDFPNDARGVSEVEQLIPNQLETNKTLARRSQIIKLTAYPRIAYDSNAIMNPDALSEVGKPIEVSSGSAQSVGQAIAYLNPAQSNSDPKNYADDLLSITQELSGSGETTMGNINPNRVAASAYIAIRDQAELPLNEQVAKTKMFIEDLAKLWVEIWMVYNPDGFDVVVKNTDPITGKETEALKRITREELDSMKPDIRIDVSKDSQWAKEAEQSWLDGMLDKNLITFEEYVELSPEHSIIPKNKLKSMFEKRKAEQERLAMQQAQAQEELTDEDIASNAMMQWEAEDGYNEQEMQ